MFCTPGDSSYSEPSLVMMLPESSLCDAVCLEEVGVPLVLPSGVGTHQRAMFFPSGVRRAGTHHCSLGSMASTCPWFFQ